MDTNQTSFPLSFFHALTIRGGRRTTMRSVVWKTHSLFRFATATHFLLLFGMVVYISASESREYAACVYEDSRLLTVEFDKGIGKYMFGSLVVGHFLAVIVCFHDELLWLGILGYQFMTLITVLETLAQAISGYVENCFDLCYLFIVAHIGMAIGLFNLHILFIYTHRGITFYQWIPLKIRELYQSLIDKNKYPKDHLIQKITGIEYKKRKSVKISLLEEDQEEFEQLIEKTCVEG